MFPSVKIEFSKNTIVCGDNGAGTVFMGGLGEPDSIRMEVKRKLFSYEGLGITSGEEVLARLVVQVRRSSGWLPICCPLIAKDKGI